MNKRALQWAAGCAVLGVLMLVFGIRDALGFHAGKQDLHQVLTLGQVVDIITAAGLLILATIILVGQLRARRRLTRHRRWLKDHPV